MVTLLHFQNWTKFKQNPLLLPSLVSAPSVTYRISNGLNLAIMKFIRIRSSIKKERERYYALYLIIYLQQMGVDMAEPGVGLSRLPQNRSLKFPSTSNPPRKNRKSLAHWSMANVTPLPPELLVTSAVATRLKLKARPPLVVEHSVRQ
jgi:hypothetical protein